MPHMQVSNGLFRQKILVMLRIWKEVILLILYLYHMNFITIFLLSLLLMFSASSPDLKIGAGGFGFGCGSNSPAAQVPYSYVRLGPDTTPRIKKEYKKFQHFGGYNTADHYLRAFSHMHLVGAGVMDMGIFGVLPLQSDNKKPSIPGKDLTVKMLKASQKATPGYYKVNLDNNVTAELTTTQRTGAHKYTLNNKGGYNINFMTGYLLDKDGKRNSTTAKCGDKCLQGSVFVNSGFGQRFGGYTVHFYLKWTTKTADKVYLFDDTHIDQNLASTSGEWTGAVIQTTAPVFEMFVGISYVSINNAKLNLKEEVPTKIWYLVRDESWLAWDNEFNRFQVVIDSADDQTKFDTALYRTFLSPTLFNDVNGQYVSFKNDGSVSTLPQDMRAVYTDMSLWDVHRTQMPWLLFHDLERFNDIAKSILLFNRQGGYMPKWPFAQGWTGCMIGSHANTVLADWVVKEAARNELTNVTEVLEFMLRNANTQTPHDSRSDIQGYKQRGYLAFDNQKRTSVSQTLEYSYNDFGISQVAGILNLTETQKDFLNRSKFYKNVWNNKTRFFEPRYKNGQFFKISKRQRINIFSNYYVEGDAWHYRFDVPHDAQGLIALFGGRDAFVKELNKFFKKSRYWPTKWLPNPYYWAGNEHDLFSVWLFSLAGRADLTEKYSRMILKTQYGLDGNGLPGNDDYATMSAWFVFAALGFYPLPSTEQYILGSPIVKSARIYRKLNDGIIRIFNVKVEHKKKGYKVESVTINGKHRNNVITHTDMSKPNTLLSFIMI